MSMSQSKLWLCVISPLRDENHKIVFKNVVVRSTGLARIELEDNESFRNAIKRDELDRNLSQIPSKQYIAFSYDCAKLWDSGLNWLIRIEKELNEQRKCVQKTREAFFDLGLIEWEAQ